MPQISLLTTTPFIQSNAGKPGAKLQMITPNIFNAMISLASTPCR
jgi:hypothetical protein